MLPQMNLVTGNYVYPEVKIDEPVNQTLRKPKLKKTLGRTLLIVIVVQWLGCVKVNFL